MYSRGLTLIELLMVLIILAITASVAVPALNPASYYQLDAGAAEIANAIRFARSESIRTGEPYGFHQQSTQNRIRVFRANTQTIPWSPVYDVYHPLSKQLYDIDLDGLPIVSVETVSRDTIFQANCNATGTVYFDRRGIPWCIDPNTTFLRKLSVTLTRGNDSRVVTLKGPTGRVSLQ